MRLISIENKIGTENVIVNADQISVIFEDNDTVKLRLTCGNVIPTKFTDVNYAVDYIQRAASHTFPG